MNDANWKTWGLIALVGLFLFAQLLRHLTMAPSVLPWDNDGFRLSKVDQPYSVKETAEHTRPRVSLQIAPLPLHGGLSREQIQKFAAANAPSTTTFDHAVTKVDDKAKKTEEKCDEKNPKIDPKTKLPIACKKKKVKEVAKAITADATPVTIPSTDQPKSDSTSNVDTTVTPGAPPAPAPVIPNKPSDSFLTLEDWQKRLLGTPDQAETKHFIEDYQKNLVTTQIFYEITTQMMADPRSDMKILGILCAGMTPSVISFQLLAQIENTERSDSPVRANAELYLQHYSDISYLSILDRVLRTPAVDYSTVAAAQRLDTSAQRYLTSTTKTSTTTPPTTTVTKASSRNISYFQRFVAILTPLEKSTNSSVAYQSLRTLTDLQNLLAAANQTTTPTTAPATPPTAVASANNNF